MNPIFLLVLLAWGAAAPPLPPPGMQDPAVVQAIRCGVRAVPPVMEAMRSGHRPLLVINGREHGPLVLDSRCEGTPRPPRGVRQIDYLRPEAAVQVWGPSAVEGLVRVRYEESPPSDR